MSIKEAISKTNIQGILAIIVIVEGFYILNMTKDASTRLAVVALMGTVLGYYFGSSKQNGANG